MPGTATAGDLLGVAAIEPDGLLVREDGTYVRALEVGAVNPLVLEPAEGERVSAAFGQVAARLPDRQSLQFYVQGTPLALDELLAADEVFVASTTREVQPVAAVDETTFAQSGPITERTASRVGVAIQSELGS